MLPRGTPIAQCFAVRREPPVLRCEAMSAAGGQCGKCMRNATGAVVAQPIGAALGAHRLVDLATVPQHDAQIDLGLDALRRESKYLVQSFGLARTIAPLMTLQRHLEPGIGRHPQRRRVVGSQHKAGNGKRSGGGSIAFVQSDHSEQLLHRGVRRMGGNSALTKQSSAVALAGVDVPDGQLKQRLDRSGKGWLARWHRPGGSRRTQRAGDARPACQSRNAKVSARSS